MISVCYDIIDLIAERIRAERLSESRTRAAETRKRRSEAAAAAGAAQGGGGED